MTFVPKRLKRIVAAAEADGWTYDLTSKGHPRLTPPKGRLDRSGQRAIPITFALTSSDIRGDRNACARLRRAGLDVRS